MDLRQSSHSAYQLRKNPTQRRGEQRVSELLEAAAAVIAESGYDGATMSAIAERAAAPIGSLYQFFPNKQSITQALRIDYAQEYDQLLVELQNEAKHLRLPVLVERLINLSVAFVESHPAFLALLDAPSSTRFPASLRDALRERLGACLVALYPELTKSDSVRLGAVTLQLLKGMNQLYAETPPPGRRQYVKEYNAVLSAYLSARLNGTARGDHR